MYKDDNYIFQVSISKDAYKNKLETKAAVDDTDGQPLREQLGIERICYYRIPVNSEKLLEYVLNGYTFCALFSNFSENDCKHVYTLYNGSYFTAMGKAGEFFEGSYFIGVDIDDTQYHKTEELVSKLSLTPTFWYTSLSHMEVEKNGICKGLRLRLIYVFDKLITDKYYFRYCASNLHKIIEYDLGEEVKDKCGLNCTQYFNGTNWNDKSISVEFEISNTIYSLSDISASDSGYYAYLNKYCEYKDPKQDIKSEIDNRICILSKHSNIINSSTLQFVSECSNSIHIAGNQQIRISRELISQMSLPWQEFYNKNKHKYPYIYRTEKTEWEKIGEIEYQWCDESYFELSWISKKQTDGQHRRHSLFHRAWMRRLIMPEITPDILLFNLAVDRERFYDNSDRQLSTSVLITKVKEAFAYDVDSLIERYKEKYEETIAKCRGKRFIIRKKPGLKVNNRSISKELDWLFIDKVYDVNLTLSENIQALEDSGFIIKEDPLRRYCKDRGIIVLTPAEKRYRRFKELHTDGLSFRKELEFLKQHGLDIELGTLQKYRARFQHENLTSQNCS